MTMREILFRGKRDDNLEWIYGYIYRITENQEMPFLMMKDYHGITYPVYPDTVGQFTGLTDKNGKKIFEGDIVHMNSKRFGLSGHGVVVFRNGGFAIDDRKRNRLYPFMQNGQYNAGDYRVDGNIHDHKELLHDSKV